MKRLSMLALLIALLALTACTVSYDDSNVQRTPIPTLPPVSQVVSLPQVEQNLALGKGDCRVYALDLIGAWAKAEAPEKDAFSFYDITGKECTATFADDVQPLFTQPNLWYAGAIACTTCHGADVTKSAAQMSLATYADILAGSRRADASAQGQSILGSAADWEKSKLHVMIATKQMPMGRPADDNPKGPLVLAGKAK